MDFFEILLPIQTIRSPCPDPVKYCFPNAFKVVHMSEYQFSPVPKAPLFEVGGPPLTIFQSLKCLIPAVANSSSVLISMSVITAASPFKIWSYFPVLVSKIPIEWSTSIATATNTFPDGEKLMDWIPFFNFDFTGTVSIIVRASQRQINGFGPSSPVAITFLLGWKAIAVTSSMCLMKCL